MSYFKAGKIFNLGLKSVYKDVFIYLPSSALAELEFKTSSI
jgi:hypothetical protein